MIPKGLRFGVPRPGLLRGLAVNVWSTDAILNPLDASLFERGGDGLLELGGWLKAVASRFC
jgi:hypothetical protein